MVQRANSRQAACGGLPVKDKPVIITAAEVAAAIKGDAPNDELVRLIRDSPEQSHGLLEQLSRDRDPVVRAWVPPDGAQKGCCAIDHPYGEGGSRRRRS